MLPHRKGPRVVSSVTNCSGQDEAQFEREMPINQVSGTEFDGLMSLIGVSVEVEGTNTQIRHFRPSAKN